MGLSVVAPGEAGSGRGGDVRAGEQAQQPEHARGGGVDVADRPGEHRPHTDGWVAHFQRVQPTAGITQLGRERGEPKAGPGSDAGSGDGQRQWQAST